MPTIPALGLWHCISISMHYYVDFANDRIAEHADQNKMTVQNLASVLGPTLLAPEGAGMEETGAQIRVAETIITFAKDMFELGITLFHLI